MAVRFSKVDHDDLEDLIIAIQDEFGVCFADDAFRQCSTVGDVFDVVWAGLPASLTSGGKCPSQIAFYRLRAAAGDRSLRPGTGLGQIPGFRYEDLRKTLTRQGWNMPGRTCARATWWGGWFVAMVTAIWLWPHSGPGALLWASTAFVATMIVLHLRVFTATGPEAATFGELARDMTALNGERLLRRGASFHRPMLWDRFVRVLAESAVRGPVVRESGIC